MANNVCADCSAPNPQWASVNRGVVICDDCCSVHRSLGRHISQVRPINDDLFWPPTLQEMFQTLVSKGANSIWEHSVNQSKGSARKPNPRDKIDNVKKKFITQKYRRLALMNRPPVKDTDLSAIEDLSQQLHASVRGNNLETVLRFLALGAKPNFQHPERGNMPLHVAASAGQQLQCELLVVYGANPCALDSRGHTPVECARIAGYHETADRLIECQYELTDRLASYVCGRRPVHISGEHHILPSLPGSTDVSPSAIEARQRLRNLPNHYFQDLASDVYDEVDRRETEQVWLETHQSIVMATGQLSVPFLPFNSSYSATRFQGRQKLATFNSRDFATLIIDILTDAKRRQMESMDGGPADGDLVPIDGLEVIQQKQLEEMREMERRESEVVARRQQQQRNLEIDGGVGGHAGDDEVLTPVNNTNESLGNDIYDRVQHDYDEVTFEAGKPKFASVDDTKKPSAGTDAADARKSSPKPAVAPKPSKTAARTKDADVQAGPPSLLNKPSSSSSLTPSSTAGSSAPKRGSDESTDAEEGDEKGRRLKEAEFRIEQLIQLNSGMGEEIRLLQAMVQKLMQENSMLRTMQGRNSSHSGGSSSPKGTSDMYVMHQGFTKSPAASTYVSAAMLQRTRGVPSSFSTSASSTSPSRSQSASEPPPLPMKTNRRHGGGATAAERSQSTSAIINSPTSPTTTAPALQQSLSLQQTPGAGAGGGGGGGDSQQPTDEGSPKPALAGNAPRGWGSPLSETRSSPVGQQRSPVLTRDSPPSDRQAVNGSPTTAPKDSPKEPPKIPPKKRRTQSVYDASSPVQQRKVSEGSSHRSSIVERSTLFDTNTTADGKTRIAATLASANGSGRSSLIISPGAKSGSSSSSGTPFRPPLARNTSTVDSTTSSPGYTSGGSPAAGRQLRGTSSAPHQGSHGNVNSPTVLSGSESGSGRSKKSRDQDMVVQQTEQITKRIQDLLRTAKSQDLTKFISCSRKIAAAVNDMAALFPNRPDSDSVRMSLAALVSSAARLKEECHVGNQLACHIRRDYTGKIVPGDEEKVRTVTQQVIQCAYDIARAARELVQHVEETIRGDTDSSN